MLWVIEKNMFYANDQMKFIDYLKETRKKYLLVDVYPFSHEIDPLPKTTNNVVVMGSTLLVKAAHDLGWGPGVWCGDDMRMDRYNDIYEDRMLNSSKDSYIVSWKNLSITGTKFIRPVEDLKSFSGTVVYEDRFEEWKEHVLQYANSADSALITDDTEVLVSTVKNIRAEYRCFIVDKKVVTGCRYRFNDKIDYLAHLSVDVEKFAKECVKIWSPEIAIVMDIADTSDGFKIIELNNFNSAGLYVCHVGNIIESVETLLKD